VTSAATAVKSVATAPVKTASTAASTVTKPANPFQRLLEDIYSMFRPGEALIVVEDVLVRLEHLHGRRVAFGGRPATPATLNAVLRQYCGVRPGFTPGSTSIGICRVDIEAAMVHLRDNPGRPVPVNSTHPWLPPKTGPQG